VIIVVLFYFSWPDVLHFSTSISSKWDSGKP